MGVQYPDGRMVTEICWVCHGTGYKIKDVQPITFKTCWMCNGWRGQFSARHPQPLSDTPKSNR